MLVNAGKYLLSGALLCVLGAAAVHASELQQTAAIPLTTTDFNPSNQLISGKDPLVFQQFDPQNGSRALDSITLSLHALIRSDFGMTFTTPATITDSVATGNAQSPGPSVTIYKPNGTSMLLLAQVPNDPAELTRSKTYGFQPGQKLPQSFGSSQTPSSPFYLPPAFSDRSTSITLNSPADLAQFTGAGTLTLPVSASAFASTTSSSGNGGGAIATSGMADVTVTYNFHAAGSRGEQVPEPMSLACWGLGTIGVVFASRWRRRLGQSEKGSR